MVRFARRLRGARERAGLTLRQLAAAAGYARSTLSLAESGSRLPGWAVTEAYVRACGQRDLSRWRGWWEAADEAGPAPQHSPVPSGPQLLPADVRGLVGRAGALRALDTAAPVVTVSGPAGVGKTALAVHWAHRRGERFPDGRLYVNLRGFSGGEPMPPDEALRILLDALGAPPRQQQASLDALASSYRGLVAGKRLVVVLDNARDAAQVRPLLPGTDTVRTLVTSRNQLTGLSVTDGAQPLALTALSDADGRALLAARLTGAELPPDPPSGGPAGGASFGVRPAGGASFGVRPAGDASFGVRPAGGASFAGRLTGADAEAVDTIVRRCAGLPLALSIVAARARQTGHPLAGLASELAEGDHVLEPLTAGDAATDLRTVFSWSYAGLGRAAAKLFRMLSLCAGPDVPEAAAAALAGTDLTRCRRELAELVDASLLETPAPRRYVLHDLLRAYAKGLVCENEDEETRRAAVSRMLDHWLATALAADRLLRPERDPMPLARLGPEISPFADRDEATAWLDAELRSLLAAVEQAAAEGYDAHAFQLVWALNSYLRRRGHWPEWARSWQLARAAAQRLGHPAAQGLALRGLAHMSSVNGRPQEALAALREAAELYRRAGDLTGEAQTCLQLCTIDSEYGDPEVALDHARRAEKLFEAAGHRRGAASAMNFAGWILAQLGRHREAAELCARSVELHHTLGAQHEEALALDSLGHALSHLGEHEEAIACCRRSAALHRELGNRVQEAGALDSLGDAHAAAGAADEAHRAWRAAYDTLRELEHPQADMVKAKLSHHDPPAAIGPL
ncbi:hypothetical protein Ade02nite_11870 [Paractinoplanes deccanensis]|uniref:HTH cro/C1-type domain-containing protein n=1 Tax=Paractinoplanes deccanensis TaxID=113561 RepID=A0ABQ3XXU1_9ACTN|nr:hypothetical protein Ade02nite_11870 [Actinoplanes deccanensis]